jgi:hypothetical protein
MAYGEIKVDTVTFTDGGIDKSVSISGLVQNPTFSGNITVTGTISGNTVQGQTVSGVTVTGTTANFVSGVFTTQISGATITGNVGSFTTITGGTVTLTSGVFASGTAAAPSVSIGTTDNGLYSPGADQVAVATNGTGRLFVDASGNVGVGTSSVNALLEVNNSTAGGEVQRIEGNYSGSGSVILTNWRRAGGSVAAALKYNDDSSPLCMSIGTTTSHEFRIRTADTDAITIDASQRVGIGTSSPGQKLEVQGSAVLFGNGTSDVDVIMGISGYGSRLEYSTGKLFLRTNNSNRLTVDNGGNVGIGTSPDSQLHVVGTGGTGLRIGYTNNTNYFDANTQIFRSNNATTVYGQWDSSGRLLVGTSSSSANARAVIQGRTTNATDQGVLYIQRGSSGPGVVADGSGIGEIWFADSNGYAAANIQCLADNTWGGGGNDYPGRLVFSTTADGASSPTERLRITSAGNLIFESGAGNTERARIDSSGRLLVGTSTSAGYHLLQIQGNTNSPLSNGSIALRRGQTNPGIEVLGEVVFTDAAGSRGASIEATTDLQWNNNDYPTRLTFSTTADGASSPTERMRITSGGNVGIGTTSPGVPLEVNGNARASNFSVPDTNFIGFGSYTAYLSGSSASNFINFSTGSTERARIDSSGRLLVGTSSGTSRLSIAGTADNANSEIQITATGIASGYIGANSNGLNIGTDTAGLVFKTGVTGGGSVGASGTERMRIDNSGRLLVGTSSARSNVYRGASSLISPVQIDSNANSYSNGINVLNYSGSGYGSVFTLGLSLSNTQGTNTVVRNNDELGYLNFVGNDGTNFRTGAWIGGEVDGTPGAGDMPGRLVFSTTADGASTPTERMRIGQNGLSYFFSSGSTVIYAGSSSAAGTTNNILQGGHSATSTTAALTSFVVHNNGNVLNTNNSYGSLSDIKLKENIVDASSQWDDLKDLKVRNYNFKEGQTHTQIGLVAQAPSPKASTTRCST